ncbi:class I SAM-dependent methyltransferase [Caballeronia insecticola]|nr:class I SAM-dependent methyltransferase [Caballeronia insecticola]
MPVKRLTYPEVRSQHVQDACLFANRKDMIKAIAPRHGAIAEVGVAIGDFSQFLVDTLAPTEFHAIDSFELHLLDRVWGVSTTELLHNKTHQQFYQDRFAHYGDLIRLSPGYSHEQLARYPANSFDLVYVDAGHDYDDAKGDTNEAVRTLRPGGMIVFNDYTMVDPLLDSEYGVVQAVNELLATEEWKVVGFALEKFMFCDIAVVHR